MRGVTAEQLLKAKKMWLEGKVDAEVAKEMKWRHTKAWEIRQYILRLPANHNWREEKKGPRQKKIPKTFD